MKGTTIVFPHHLGVVVEKDTVSGDSLTQYPAEIGPWSVNPPHARHGAGKFIKIAWIDASRKIRSGMIAS